MSKRRNRHLPAPAARTLAWRDGTQAQRAAAARAISRVVSFFGNGYDVVTPPFSEQRRRSVIETKGEDKILTPAQRNRIVNLSRDMMRNSPTRLSQDQQVRVHVVGSCGGKLYASFPEEFRDSAAAVTAWFNQKWFPRAEFTFRKNFNWLLKTCLTSMDTSGDTILVFDDGILTGGDGTGRIRGFEGDEIAGLADADFKARFPEGYSQSRGFVYDECGVFCGAFVSTSQRGRDRFTVDGGVVTLRMDPYSGEIPNWIRIGDMRRFNQGRAVSPLVAALTTLIDLHETCASEAQSAKLNSQMIGQILRSESAPTTAPGAFSAAGSEDADAAAELEEFSTPELEAIGAHFDSMPEGVKIDLFDTKRPNLNIISYAEFLTGQVGAVKGLARVYSTLKAQTSYTAYRGEQVMTEPSFEEARQDLERDVCDWAARLAISRAARVGELAAPLPDGWQNMIAWEWPTMREVSEADAQRALQLKLQNGVTSLHRELGPGEYERIREERRREAADAREDGLVYQGSVAPAGVPVETWQPGETDDENNEEGATEENE